MFFFNHTFNNLEDVFWNIMEDTYDAEIRLTTALQKMADAATSQDLKQAFNEHLQETQVHIQRLEDCFRRCGCEPERETCEAMKGLIGEGSESINADGDGHARDAAMIAAAQKVEHYEIAAYGTLRTLAMQCNKPELAPIFEQTLQEEKNTDLRLTGIAESHVNAMAQH
jgi:ferritin-like metal-binding protein YciE